MHSPPAAPAVGLSEEQMKLLVAQVSTVVLNLLLCQHNFRLRCWTLQTCDGTRLRLNRKLVLLMSYWPAVMQVAAAGAAGVTDIDKLTKDLMLKLGTTVKSSKDENSSSSSRRGHQQQQ